MRFVLDASIVATWALRDEDHPVADLAFVELQNGSAVAPEILWYEVRNILVSNERRERITAEDCVRFLESLERMNIAMDARPRSSLVMEIAWRHTLSIYDAAYLALAAREDLPLATLDKALQSAARAAGVALVG